MWHAGSWFPNQGLNPCCLQWKYRVLTTGSQGKSLILTIFSVQFSGVKFIYGWCVCVCVCNHHHHSSLYMLSSCKTETLHPLNNSSPFLPLLSPWIPPFYCSVSRILTPTLSTSYKVIMQYFSFCD